MEQITPGSKFKQIKHNENDDSVFKNSSDNQEFEQYTEILARAKKFCADFSSPTKTSPFYNILKLYLILDLDLHSIQTDAVFHHQAKEYRKTHLPHVLKNNLHYLITNPDLFRKCFIIKQE